MLADVIAIIGPLVDECVEPKFTERANRPRRRSSILANLSFFGQHSLPPRGPCVRVGVQKNKTSFCLETQHETSVEPLSKK
jgi:hypothetical protein